MESTTLLLRHLVVQYSPVEYRPVTVYLCRVRWTSRWNEERREEREKRREEALSLLHVNIIEIEHSVTLRDKTRVRKCKVDTQSKVTHKVKKKRG